MLVIYVSYDLFKSWLLQI